MQKCKSLLEMFHMVSTLANFIEKSDLDPLEALHLLFSCQSFQATFVIEVQLHLFPNQEIFVPKKYIQECNCQCQVFQFHCPVLQKVLLIDLDLLHYD